MERGGTRCCVVLFCFHHRLLPICWTGHGHSCRSYSHLVRRAFHRFDRAEDSASPLLVSSNFANSYPFKSVHNKRKRIREWSERLVVPCDAYTKTYLVYDAKSEIRAVRRKERYGEKSGTTLACSEAFLNRVPCCISHLATQICSGSNSRLLYASF